MTAPSVAQRGPPRCPDVRWRPPNDADERPALSRQVVLQRLPSAETACSTTEEGPMSANYPKRLGERQALREQILADHLTRARRTASVSGRSVKCGAPPWQYRGWKHASDPDGCINDGSGCLCECHDPEPNVDVQGPAHPGGDT